ncbi:MAG TPA: hypothetical protein VG711_07775 [Phycisphaerales bacterium]|nr:hypothetical protein [Phycisphaerales bacterium]
MTPPIIPNIADKRTVESRGDIEVSMRDISQLFNSIDPSPFYDKDLDADAEEFIIAWAREYSPDDPLRLIVHLQQPLPKDSDPVLVENAVQNYFTYRACLAQREFSQLMRTGRTSLLIGLFFLTACVLAAQIIDSQTKAAAAQIFRESFLIGGWVAMWRPMEIFLYDWWPLMRRRRLFERLSRMSVRIRVKEDAEGVKAAG